MTTNQLERISEMERRLDLIKQATRELTASLDRYIEVQGDIKLLDEYYGSEDWRRDLDDDAADRLPKNLKRGVLSEDAVWDTLSDIRALNERLGNLAQTLNK